MPCSADFDQCLPRIAPKVLLPGEGCEETANDTLRQKWLLPWQEWIQA